MTVKLRSLKKGFAGYFKFFLVALKLRPHLFNNRSRQNSFTSFRVAHSDETHLQQPKVGLGLADKL